MTQEKTQKAETSESNVIDDLTLEETKTEDVKGGGRNELKDCFVADSFSFGVEREMK
jgi:hypothetical protein